MKRIWLISIIVMYCGCMKDSSKIFQSLAPNQSGIYFKNQLLSSESFNILNYIYFYNGAGVAAADFNSDGLIDLYFTSNQNPDELYLNRGNLQFENVTSLAGIQNDTGWTTGVTQVDINSDGLLDIYVCKLGAYKSITGHNLLWVNQGNDVNGIPQFKEESKAYGLDIMSFATQAAFFDMDLDNDLDMFLLNHSVYPNRNYGFGHLRMQQDLLAGDRLFENQAGSYKDISEKAGIFQGKIGYGLGVSVADINGDLYPDIYVGNDFFENDYLYINQKNGTFREAISRGASMDHTTHYSMGNTIVDLTNDGLPEILSLDMLPEDQVTYQTSGMEYSFPIYQEYLKKGYQHQFMQNTLQLNWGRNNFSEIAFLSGIAATEWSWAPLVADFDNDGWKDIYITNGILGATNDMDYINFISDAQIQKQLDQDKNTGALNFIHKIPTKKVSNYFYKNNRDLTFKDVSKEWIKAEKTYSNGAVYADFDNDGDLDIVVNNVNDYAQILENTSEKKSFVQVELQGPEGNRFGIGSRVSLLGKTNQVQQLQVSQGYLSSLSNRLHFAIPDTTSHYKIQVEWPDGKQSILDSIPFNTIHQVNYQTSRDTRTDASKKELIQPRFESVSNLISFTHKEYQTLDYNRQPIIPFTFSNEGPPLAVGDINQDALEDIIVGGAKAQSTSIFIQKADGTFEPFQEHLMQQDRMAEDTALHLIDIEGDGDLDLLVGSGGNEFRTGEKLYPRLYRNMNGSFESPVFPFGEVAVNTSSISSADVDKDGDLDVFITTDIEQTSFGIQSRHYLFLNDGRGNFSNVSSKWLEELQMLPSIKDVQWQDLNGDGYEDLVVAGYWSPISIFTNTGDRFEKVSETGLETSKGWWNCLELSDVDNDGDLDIIAGNWGLNSLFKASSKQPIHLYLNDFDSNGTVDPLITHFLRDKEIPFASKDKLTKQMPMLNKKFLSYHDFANATIEQMFGKERLNEAIVREVTELRTCYFENIDGQFKKIPLPNFIQMAPVNEIVLVESHPDFGTSMVLLGNNTNISTQLGEMSANKGFLVQYTEAGKFSEKPLEVLGIQGVVQSSAQIKINTEEHLFFGRNNDSIVVYKKIKAHEGKK